MEESDFQMSSLMQLPIPWLLEMRKRNQDELRTLCMLNAPAEAKVETVKAIERIGKILCLRFAEYQDYLSTLEQRMNLVVHQD